MSILGVQSRQDVYSSLFAQKSSTRPIESPFGRTTKSDTVHISEKAKELSQKAQTEKIATGQPDTATTISYDDLPVEAFAFPGWFSELIPDEAILDDKVGLSLSLPDNRQAHYDSSSGKSMDEIGEYLDTLLKYFQEEVENKGIGDNVDYYTSIVQDEKMSEEVHQAVKNRLFDDPRVMELMQYFGVTL